MKRRTVGQVRGGRGFGYVVGRVACAECGARELAQLRRYPDGSLHLLTPDNGTSRLLSPRRLPDGARRAVPVLDLELDELRPDARLRCRKHGMRALTGEVVEQLRAGVPTRPVTARI